MLQDVEAKLSAAGISVDDLSPEERTYLGIKPDGPEYDMAETWFGRGVAGAIEGTIGDFYKTFGIDSDPSELASSVGEFATEAASGFRGTRDTIRKSGGLPGFTAHAGQEAGRAGVGVIASIPEAIAIAADGLDEAMGTHGSVRERAMYRYGQGIRDVYNGLIPYDPEHPLSGSFVEDVASGFGSSIGMLGFGAGMQAVGIPGNLGVAVTGMAVEGANAWREVYDATGDEELAWQAYLLQGAMGSVEAVSLGGILKGMGGAKRMLIDTATEVATEGWQTMWGNIVAEHMTKHDPDRELWDGVVRSGLAAGFSMPAVHGAVAAMRKGASLARGTRADTADLPATPDIPDAAPAPEIVENEDGTFTYTETGTTEEGGESVSEITADSREAVERELAGEDPVAAEAEPDADTPEAVEKTYSAKNENVAAELEEMGLPPVTKAESETFEGWRKSAAIEIETDSERGADLVDELEADMREVTPVETAILHHERTRLSLKRDRIETELIEAFESGDTELVAAKELERDKIRDRFEAAADVFDKSGTKLGQALAVRRLELKEDYSLAALERKTRAAQGGETLTAEQTESLKAASEELKVALAEIAELTKQLESKPKPTPRKRSKATPKPGKATKFVRARAAEARKRIAARRGRAMMGVDPFDLADHAIVGAEYIANGIVDLKAWSETMIEEFGDTIKPRIEELYAKSKAYLSAESTGLDAGAEEAALQANLATAKRKADTLIEDARLSSRTRGQKVKDGLDEVISLPRAIMTSWDASAVLRQGGFFALGHPVQTARNVGGMMRAAVSESYALRQDAAIRNRPGAALADAAGLEISTLDGTITTQEEAIRSRLSDLIPGMKASNRAFVSFLNLQRANMFDLMVRSAPGGTVTIAQAKDIAHAVNIGTGRGDPGRFAGAVTALSPYLWAPRLLLSRVQLATQAAGLLDPKHDPATRKIIAKEYARSLVGLSVVYALASMLGADIDEDTRSSDFGKLRVGRSRLDPLAGFAQIMTLGGRVASGEVKSSTTGRISPIRGEGVPYGGATTTSIIGRFLRSKLNPTLGATLTALDGVDFKGDPVDAASLAKDYLVPISFYDIKEALEEQGVERGAALGILSILGWGIQTYDAPEEGATEFYEALEHDEQGRQAGALIQRLRSTEPPYVVRKLDGDFEYQLHKKSKPPKNTLARYLTPIDNEADAAKLRRRIMAEYVKNK